MPPIAASFTKVLSSWSNASLAGAAAAWPVCPVWAKTGGAASSPTPTTAVVVSKRTIMITPGSAFSPFNRRVRAEFPIAEIADATPSIRSTPAPFSLSVRWIFHPAGNFDKGPKYSAVALADLEFGVPLHPETETAMRILDPLDDAVLGDGVDDEPRPGGLDRLMVRAVDPEAVHSSDAVQKGPGDHPDSMPGSLRGLGWRCGRQSGTSSGMCWINVPPSATFRSCWPPRAPASACLGRARPLPQRARRQCGGPWS